METLQPDPRAALGFYGSVFGWEFSQPAPMPAGLPGEYFIASVDDHAVAGIGTLPDLGGQSMPAWNTHVRVGGADPAVERAKSAGGSLVLGPSTCPATVALPSSSIPAGQRSPSGSRAAVRERSSSTSRGRGR